MLRRAGCVVQSGFKASQTERVFHPGHRPSALRSYNALTALPESFGQLMALEDLDVSQRSACAKVWRGPCAAVVWVHGAEWVPG